MQNDDHPLVKAMGRESKKYPSVSRETLLADLPGKMEGDAVELKVLGVVKSIGADGKASIEVQQVSDYSMKEEHKPSMTMTQES